MSTKPVFHIEALHDLSAQLLQAGLVPVRFMLNLRRLLLPVSTMLTQQVGEYNRFAEARGYLAEVPLQSENRTQSTDSGFLFFLPP